MEGRDRAGEVGKVESAGVGRGRREEGRGGIRGIEEEAGGRARQGYGCGGKWRRCQEEGNR